MATYQQLFNLCKKKFNISWLYGQSHANEKLFLTEKAKQYPTLCVGFLNIIHPDRLHIIDTTGMLPNTLNHWIRNFVRAKKGRILLTFESFGFKRGLPMASDLVFDVRCLPNPYWEEDLRKYTGKDQPVIDYLRSKPEVQEMISDIQNFVEKWLPSYEAQNRHYLTVSIGCTGGQHRSVYIAETLARHFSKSYEGVIVRHRTLDAVASKD